MPAGGLSPPPIGKLGLIAGGGALPLALAERCRKAGRPFYVLRLKGFADKGLKALEGGDAGIAELGKVFDLLRKAGCENVCFAGLVTRPDFTALKPDLRGLKALPGAIAAARSGDDSLMRFMLGEFEKEGFTVEGADAVDASLTLPAGLLGRIPYEQTHFRDIQVALATARAIGALDIGQAAIVVDGLVLAVEAQEGTAEMLRRCAKLPAALRGTAQARRGVVAKAPKPIQDHRVDLPVIGPETIKLAAAAGLAGVVGEAGGVLVLDRIGVITAAAELGLFVLGLPPDPE